MRYQGLTGPVGPRGPDVVSEEQRKELVTLLRQAVATQEHEIERERRNPLLRWFRRFYYG